MSKIYIDVPEFTNQTTVSVPCGKEDEYLWQFTIIFNENEYLQQRIVTIMDNNCEDGEKTIQSMLVKNSNNRMATFEYHLDKDDIKADITVSVFFCQHERMIIVEW